VTTEVQCAPRPLAEPVRPRRWRRPAAWLRADGHRGLLVALLLAAWTVAFWGRSVLRDFGDLRLSSSGDSESFEYYLV